MATITQKKKLSKSAWALVLIALIAVVAVVVLAVMGVIDLSPVSNAFMGIYMWASTDIINALLISAGWFVLGVLFYYVAIKYFVGNKVTTALPTYTPQGQTLSQPPAQSGSETVIS